mmetsp:Transcript_33336/g.76167  ORF Transcript_33336/g.76167 Transcript_33336/m.76167 type:complete len:219 (-) Transcript_33336:1796-2452(-)
MRRPLRRRWWSWKTSNAANSPLPPPSGHPRTCACVSPGGFTRHHPQNSAWHRWQLSAKHPVKSRKAARQCGAGQRRTRISSTNCLWSNVAVRSKASICWMRRNSAMFRVLSASTAAGNSLFTAVAHRSSTSLPNTSSFPAAAAAAPTCCSKKTTQPGSGQRRFPWASTLCARAPGALAAPTRPSKQSQHTKCCRGHTQPPLSGSASMQILQTSCSWRM